MKKILIIQHYGGVGGSGIGLLTTIKALTSSYSITVYCPETPDSLFNYYKELGIDVKFIHTKIGALHFYNGGTRIFSPNFWKSFLNIFKSYRYWKNVFLDEKPDLVLVNSMIMAWMQIPARRCNVKIVCHVRETLPSILCIRKILIHRWLNRFDGVMFISKYDMKKHSLRTKQTIVPDSLREDTYCYTDEPFSVSKKILFVGGSDPIKGLHVLLKALKYVDNDIKVIIAGKIPKCYLTNERISLKLGLKQIMYYFRVKPSLNNHDIMNHVIFVGQCNDITKLYNDCDFVVFPSQTPHQSRPVIEAGQFRKPAIISDFRATSENLINDFNGKTFRYNSPKSLSNCIREMYKDFEKLQEMGNHNYEMTMTNHSFDYMKKELLKFVDDIIE